MTVNSDNPENREEGTDELANNYASNTPGQSTLLTFKEFMRGKETDKGEEYDQKR